jgi:hypothetical protein
MPEFSLDRLREPLSDLMTWLSEVRVPAAIVGGVAASLLGRARFTRDIDAVVVVDESRWPEFLDSARRHGFQPRRPDSLEFARRSRVLLLIHGPSAVELDISLGALPFEEGLIAAAKTIEVGGVSLPVARPEDIVIMKAIARRPRDISDIEGLLAANPAIDRAFIRRNVASAAEALDSPEILADLDRWFAATPGKRRHRKRQ